MDYLISGYQPEFLFKTLEDIIAIPRGSGNEAKISAYVMDFARERGYECVCDDAYNVIVKKPASPGCEGMPPVMLQGHLDIVCEKNGAVKHDFTADPVRTKLEDGILRAVGTTLGADNGAGLAMMLAVLDDKSLVHPRLECVFTAQEETAFVGAAALDTSWLDAATLINLDSEEEGTAIAGCAGGMRVKCQLPITWLPCPFKYPLKVRVGGLIGGHSGTDIHLERGNANKTLARILNSLNVRVFFYLAGVSGGNLDNAIPREADAVLVFETEEKRDIAIKAIDEHYAIIADEMKHEEPGFAITWEIRSELPAYVIDSDSSNRFISFTYLAPNGVTKRSNLEGGMVVASLNMGVVRADSARITVSFALRSSIDSLKSQLLTQILILAGCFSFHTESEASYPGWEYVPDSRARELFLRAHDDLYGKPGKVETIHAGLECGLFLSKMPGLDAISIGPDIMGAHSPDESLDLSSLERTYSLLCLMLKMMANS